MQQMVARCSPWERSETGVGFQVNPRFWQRVPTVPRLYLELQRRCLEPDQKLRPSFQAVQTELLAAYDTLMAAMTAAAAGAGTAVGVSTTAGAVSPPTNADGSPPTIGGQIGQLPLASQASPPTTNNRGRVQDNTQVKTDASLVTAAAGVEADAPGRGVMSEGALDYDRYKLSVGQPGGNSGFQRGGSGGEGEERAAGTAGISVEEGPALFMNWTTSY